MSQQKEIIGTNTHISLLGRTGVPAKIDTGADSSAIWASDIKITRDNILKFKLFGPGSPFYTGKVIKRTDFKVAQVKSSNGQSEIRYRTKLAITVNGRRLRVLFNLSDRANGRFPVLLGRRTLKNKFLVDVSEYHIPPTSGQKTAQLQQKLLKNPRQFYLSQKRKEQKS